MNTHVAAAPHQAKIETLAANSFRLFRPAVEGSVGIQHQPCQACVHDEQTDIGEWSSPDELINSHFAEHRPGEHHRDQARDTRDEPGWEKCPFDVDQWVTSRHEEN